jgi:hypothetical protein
MTLAELLADLSNLDDDLTIYTAISPYARPDTPAIAAADLEDGSLPAGVTGMGYFLEVSVARDILDQWRVSRPGKTPTPQQAVEAVVHYTLHAEYLPAAEPTRESKSATLYRPVGPEELALIEDAGWKRFPPRLEWQPIFYPVLTEAYATTIARDWNVKASGVGYVTKFAVRSDYLAKHEVHEAGGRALCEYWIPAEELDEFNDAIIGAIEVISEWRGLPPAQIHNRPRD